MRTESDYATIDVMHLDAAGKITSYKTVWVSESEWVSLNYIDYIELDAAGNLMPEFMSAHAPDVQSQMLEVSKRLSHNSI